jgi:hypothetical protein
MLLGFSSRCPSTCVLAELGWHRISSSIVCERWRLLKRLLASDNVLVQTVLECSLGDATSWLVTCIESLRPWTGATLPVTQHAWSRLLQESTDRIRSNEADEILTQCACHKTLRTILHRNITARARGASTNSYIRPPSIRTPRAKSVGCSQAVKAYAAEIRARQSLPLVTTVACSAPKMGFDVLRRCGT